MKELEFHPLTPERWEDLELLFGARGACGGCWCMLWRLSRSQFERQKGEQNRAALGALVDSGKVPGILAYADGRPAGWCAVARREEYPALERSRVLKRVDEKPVWSVVCLFVDKAFRGRGVSVGLLRGAIEHVKRSGGNIVEGYPCGTEEGPHARRFRLDRLGLCLSQGRVYRVPAALGDAADHEVRDTVTNGDKFVRRSAG